MLLLLWKVEENVRERERWLCKTNRPRGALGDLVGFLGCSGSKMSLSPLLFLPLPLLCGWRWLLRPPFTLARSLVSIPLSQMSVTNILSSGGDGGRGAFPPRPSPSDAFLHSSSRIFGIQSVVRERSLGGRPAKQEWSPKATRSSAYPPPQVLDRHGQHNSVL